MRKCLVVLGTVLLLAACSSDGAIEATGEETVEPGGAVLQPGEVIADGFVVAEATVVPGGAFPNLGATYDGVPAVRSWSAVIQSERELPEVLAAYVNQAIDLGYRVPGFGAGTEPSDVAAAACSVTRAQSLANDDLVVVPPSPPPGTPLYVQCFVHADRVVDGHWEDVDIGGSRTYPAAHDRPMDYLSISLLRWPKNRGIDMPTEKGSQEERSSSKATLPSAPPPWSLPDTGGDEPLIGCSSPTLIGPGSRLLRANVSCGFPIFYDMVVEVTGDAGDVFDSYVQQIGAASGFNPPVKVEEPSEFDGRSVRAADIGADGSSSLRVTMMADKDRPTVLLVAYEEG